MLTLLGSALLTLLGLLLTTPGSIEAVAGRGRPILVLHGPSRSARPTRPILARHEPTRTTWRPARPPAAKVASTSAASAPRHLLLHQTLLFLR